MSAYTSSCSVPQISGELYFVCTAYGADGDVVIFAFNKVASCPNGYIVHISTNDVIAFHWNTQCISEHQQHSSLVKGLAAQD